MAEDRGLILDYLLENIPNFIPQLSVNCVVFRYSEKRLEVAVVRPIDLEYWVIPGGYIFQDESVDEAAKRILFRHVQIPDLLLNQFGTYGDKDRHFLAELSELTDSEFPEQLGQWLSQRFVTICYYSVLGAAMRGIETSPLYETLEWRDVTNLSDLGLDHDRLAEEGLRALAGDLSSKPLLLQFMSDEFTLPELQGLYEAILGRKIDRGNFRQRMLKSGILIKTGNVKKDAPSRPPLLYRFNRDTYLNSLTDTVKLGF